ncbi:hypothetical protein [Arthrobacter sp. efr-133-TYG-104]|uniref:hypothetical protein n=1 Tax=Arthrobacter sp. efr-133-TYG-104 TaxID=3040324 RepID=UPI0025502E49|nr:hypothetical protein [Arthrobacter sp. efr-133-TYG-104]
MTEVQRQDVNGTQRTWKWWRRGEGSSAAEPSLTETPEAEPPEVDFVSWELLQSTPVYQEASSVYFADALGDRAEQEEDIMSSLDEAIRQLLSIEGATGAAIVDYSSGMALAQGGSPGFDLGVAAAGNSNVVSAKLRTMADLNLNSDIEDILITLGSQYHLINVLNSGGSKGLFVYLVLDRTYANLALARHKLNNLANGIII